MEDQLTMAYRLGQAQAFNKYASNPYYNSQDIQAIRRYNKDVAGGKSNWSGAATGIIGGLAGAQRGGWKGALIGTVAGGLLGKGLGYAGNRWNQGFDNSLYTDVNSQANRNDAQRQQRVPR
jgi:uncharacterized protein YcfJ